MSNEPGLEHHRDPYADDELVPFDVQGYSGKKGMWLLALLVVLLLILAVVLFRAYSSGFRDRTEAPKILATDAPDKVASESADGETPKDLAIYDAMKGEAETGNVTVTESSEGPATRPGTVQIDVKDRNSSSETNTDPIVTPAPKPVQTAPVATPPTISSGDSRYVVQLASLRTRGAAEDTWASIQSKHKAVLPQGSYMDIVQAEVPNKGTFYRLRLAGLSDKNLADRVCNQLKSRSQTCFTTSK